MGYNLWSHELRPSIVKAPECNYQSFPLLCAACLCLMYVTPMPLLFIKRHPKACLSSPGQSNRHIHDIYSEVNQATCLSNSVFWVKLHTCFEWSKWSSKTLHKTFKSAGSSVFHRDLSLLTDAINILEGGYCNPITGGRVWCHKNLSPHSLMNQNMKFWHMMQDHEGSIK